MKLPQVPPKLEDVAPATFVEAMVQHRDLVRAEQDGRYLHWDELRRRPAPHGVTSETWWLAIRVARDQLARTLPLTDASGRPFSFVMTDKAQKIVHEVDRDASGLIEMPEDITNRSTRDRYVVASLIEEAFRSSQLEGASTTRAVAKEMIRTKRPPRDESERMILNNFYAMEWVRDNKDRRLTKQAVFELHSIVTHETLEVPDGAGRFRRSDEPVRVLDLSDGQVLHTPPPADQLERRMDQLCAFANGTSEEGPFVHPVVRAILLHFWLAYDHPFVDGNGRTARALFYWSMLHQKYWLTEFISISRVINKSRVNYDRAFLFTETDNNDVTYFLLHQLGVLSSAITELYGYLKRKTEEVRTVEAMLRGRDDLNHRQLALLSHALRHHDARYTIEGHQMSHRVVYQTARTDLLGLVERRLLQQFKSGKKLLFSPVRDLEKKLSRQH